MTNLQHQDVGIIGDGHVHFYPDYDIERFFRCAFANFRAAAVRLQAGKTPIFFLLLTESAGHNLFSRLRREKYFGQGLRILTTGEAQTLAVHMQEEMYCFVVAGRQIVTAESLEVLALGMNSPFPDGLPLREVLAGVCDSGALAVLPWGVGKWLGRRGKIMRSLVESAQAGDFFLGDNGNRPFFWPISPLFSKAAERGIFNLPGSDPLPFAGQENKAGSFGFYLDGNVEPDAPFSGLKHLLTEAARPPGTYGRPERILPFLHHQFSMQAGRFLNR